jgi:hypothetical protein
MPLRSCHRGPVRNPGTPDVRTAAGMRATDAAGLVQNMAARFRIPDALRRADTPARTGPPGITRPATTLAKNTHIAASGCLVADALSRRETAAGRIAGPPEWCSECN